MKAFGDSCSDFDLPENSEWAAELVKEGFTLEFMKNAIIRSRKTDDAPNRRRIYMILLFT